MKLGITTLLFTLIVSLLSCEASTMDDNKLDYTPDLEDEAEFLDDDYFGPTDEIKSKYPCSMGNNPIINIRYSADPTARVFDDVLYLYPSTDIDGGDDISFNGFCMPGYYAYSTENFFDWADHGKLFFQEDVAWAIQDKYCMWAPDCVKYGDKYYYYFPSLAKVGDFKIGVGISDNPEGPFTLEPNFIAGISNIDPNVFIDDDNKAYIISGGGHINFKMAELDSSMTKIVGEAFEILGPEYVDGDYKEAPFIFKRNGIYYLTYPYSLNGGGSNLHYATSDNIKGPYTPKGQFLGSVNCWTSHHSIVEYRGEWILFYHSNQISGQDKRRSVCADYISFSNSGDIIPVVQTLRGVGTTPADRMIQIDKYSSIANATVQRLDDNFPASWVLTNLNRGSVVTYDRVGFSAGNYNNIHVRLKSSTSRGKMIIKNNTTGELIANINLPSTNGIWKSYSTDISGVVPHGTVDLKIEFEGDLTRCAIDWIRFE